MACVALLEYCGDDGHTHLAYPFLFDTLGLRIRDACVSAVFDMGEDIRHYVCRSYVYRLLFMYRQSIDEGQR